MSTLPPPAPSPAPSPASDPAPTPGRASPLARWAAAVLAAIVVFALGCAVGVWVLAGDDEEVAVEEVELADFEAEVACQLSDDLPRYDELSGYDDPATWRLEAVVGLAQAASRGDRFYRRLGEAAEDLRLSLVRFDDEVYDDAFDRLRDECESLYPPTD